MVDPVLCVSYRLASTSTKKPGSRPGFCRSARGSDDLHLFGLQAFLATGHREGHVLTFLQALEA